ncbi:MAG: PKD domain-containing protein [Salibacteraceae bacterium]
MNQVVSKFFGKGLMLVLLIAFIGISHNSKATHMAGGSIKYENVGVNQYLMTVTVFRKCGATAGYTSTTEKIGGRCMPGGTASTYTLPVVSYVAPTPTQYGGPYAGVNVGFGTPLYQVQEISDVCDKLLDPSRSPSTNCRGGGAQGYLKYVFQDIITITPCNYWRFWFRPPCCRNSVGGTSNLSTGSYVWVETWFDTQNFPTNSAPNFADEVKPIPTVCMGKRVNYGVGTVDLDGDSLRFEAVCALTDSSTCVTYRSGYTATAPADSFELDPNTGLITFVPKTTGIRVVAFWVKEYERCTGLWKAQTLRDVQFRVEACSNNLPHGTGSISNLTGKNTTKLGNYKLQACNGTTFSFEDTIFDPDATDTLVFLSNHDIAMPGSQMTVNVLQKNKAVVKFTWKADIGLNPTKNFFLVFNDDRCNYPGNGFSVYEIEVKNATAAGEDQAICLGVDTAYLEAAGGSHFFWETVYGDSLIWTGPNRNIWGDTSVTDTNKYIKFFPTKTTFLEVSSNLQVGCFAAAACQDRDSVKVVAAKNYNLIKHADTMICYHDSTIQIFANPDSSHFSYTYDWQDSTLVSNSKIANPFATVTSSQYMYVDVESDSGCAKRDSIYIGVTPPMPANILLTSMDNPACSGVAAQIDMSLGKLPSACGATTDPCIGPLLHESSQSTTNSNGSGATPGLTNWPCPYGAAQSSGRQQFIYTKHDLQLMGVGPGTLDGLGFNVVAANGVGSLSGYTIKLGCVPLQDSVLGAYFVNSGLTTVVNPRTVSPQVGWNLHAFDVNYDYSGTTNLVVDVCWNNGSGNTSSNASVAYVATGHRSCNGYMSQSANVCGNQSIGYVSGTNRPTIQLSYCGARSKSEFTYAWTPTTGLNHDTISDPIASISVTSTYTVEVTDTFGKCSDTASITLTVAKLDAGPDTSMCANDTIQLFPSFTASCSGVSNFVWAPSANFVNDTARNPLVTVSQTTMITVSYSDACGCTLVDSMLIYADSVKFNYIQKEPSCGQTDGAYIFGTTGGTGYFNYSIDSGNTWSLSDTIGGLSVGYFGLIVRDSMQCLSEISPDTMLNKIAPVIDSVIVTDVTCGGYADGKLEIVVSGGLTPLSYSVDSGTTWGTSNIITNLNTGKYKVLARGRLGCESFPEYATITEPDTLFVQFETNVDSCYQQGHGYAKAFAQAGTPPYSYTWSGVAAGASHNPVVVNSNEYTRLFKHSNYKLVLKDANGCGLDTTFAIDEIDQIVVDSVGQISTTCFGYPDGQIYMRGTGGNAPDSLNNWWYEFSADSGRTFYGPLGGGVEKATLIDSAKSKFYGAPNSKYYSGIYNLTIRDGKGCLGHTTVTVTEPPEMKLTTTTDSIRICVSTCTKLEVFSTGGNGVNHVYNWTPTVSNTNVANVCPDQDEIYSVYATDNRGCSSNGLILKVDLFDSLSVTTTGDTSICEGSYAQLNAIAKGGDGAGYEYLWQPFTDLSNAFIKNPIASPGVEKAFVVKLTDLCGSPAVYDSVLISILPQPLVKFSADTLEGCPPLYSKFENNTNASSFCRWDFGDGTYAETCQSVYKTYTQDGKYDVKLTVTSVDGCVDSLIKSSYIDIYKVPTASFSVSPQPATILNTNIRFHDYSDGRIVKWEWNFAGLDTSTKRHPVYRFPDNNANTYPVRLDVYSDQGCTDDTIRIVHIDAEYFLYIPTSFTPNGDGKNDVWKPLGTGFESDYYHILVFDRWGKLVFESYDYNDYWDGVVLGATESAPVGVYTWKIVTGDAENVKKRHERYGNVTIVR